MFCEVLADQRNSRNVLAMPNRTFIKRPKCGGCSGSCRRCLGMGKMSNSLSTRGSFGGSGLSRVAVSLTMFEGR